MTKAIAVVGGGVSGVAPVHMMIVVVPCGVAKRSHRTAAGAMYTGAYHRACMRYARSIVVPEQIRILSAKYGLLELADEIEPYNLKMGQPGCVTAAKVWQQAQRAGILDATVIALGGRHYTAICRAVWPACFTPLKGVGGMGKQMQWLIRHYGRVCEETT